MCVHVYVYGCLNISVPVSVHVCACVSGYLVACAYRRVTVTQSSAARQPASPRVPRSSQAGTSQAGLCRQHGTRGLRGMSVWHSGHGRHAQRRRSPPPCCGWCTFCFCGVLLCWCACCCCWYVRVWSCVLCVLWWTRVSLSEDNPCGH